MRCKRTLLLTFVIADVAFERFLSSVRSMMIDKSGLILRFIIAKFAFKGHLARVQSFMTLEAIGVFASGFAKVAIKSVSLFFVPFQFDFQHTRELAVETS